MTKTSDHTDDAMPVLHLTEGADGISRFSDLQVPLNSGGFAPPAPPMPVSEVKQATGLLYLILPAGWDGAQHPSPRRQVAFCLSGRLRVEAGDGAVREFGAGAIWRMEDVAGSGHTTTVLGDEDVRLAIVQLPPHPGDLTREEQP
jgi:quercetin dioxygenase-like cupin family protein